MGRSNGSSGRPSWTGGCTSGKDQAFPQTTHAAVSHGEGYPGTRVPPPEALDRLLGKLQAALGEPPLSHCSAESASTRTGSFSSGPPLAKNVHGRRPSRPASTRKPGRSSSLHSVRPDICTATRVSLRIADADEGGWDDQGFHLNTHQARPPWCGRPGARGPRRRRLFRIPSRVGRAVAVQRRATRRSQGGRCRWTGFPDCRGAPRRRRVRRGGRRSR
jgi:hypothetical protein